LTTDRRKLLVTLYIVIMSLILLVTATYAWMEISSSPTVSDLALSLVSDNALLLAPDAGGEPGSWSSIMDLSEFQNLEAPLQPVTYSAAEDAFYEPEYGWDGRMANVRGTKLDNNASSIMTYDFWMMTETTTCGVQLSQGAASQNGELGSGTFVVGEPVWDQTTITHKDGGQGVQNAIRVGFRVWDEDGNPGDLIIYEPNADGGSGALETTSIDGGLLQGDHKIIRQYSSSWEETFPVLNDEVIYSVGKFFDGENDTLVHLKAGIPVRITLYIWLEGQDADCTNSISAIAGRILANFQFEASGVGDLELQARDKH